MIRINLANKKQASYAGGKTGAFSTDRTGSFSLKSLTNNADVTTLMSRILVPLGLCVLAHYGFEYYADRQNDGMQNEVTVVEKEKVRLQGELKKVKGFEAVKADLERNELILRTKLDTIERLIKGRDFTVKSLIALSGSMPREIWMNEIVATDTNYSLKGSTQDIGMVSDFMSKLGQTVYFKEVALKGTTSDPTGKQANFELTARRE